MWRPTPSGSRHDQCPRDSDPIHLTDPESRILPAGSDFVQGYNAQAANDRQQITPLIARKRESHSGWLDRRLASPPVMPDHPTALEKMRFSLATPEGKAAYGLRKCSVEPRFGIIKQVMRFRQFLVRGLENVQAEWGWCAWRSS